MAVDLLKVHVEEVPAEARGLHSSLESVFADDARSELMRA
jgi:hypothetical protein